MSNNKPVTQCYKEVDNLYSQEHFVTFVAFDSK